MNAKRLLFLAPAFLCFGPSFAQDADPEPKAILELGSAVARSFGDSQWSAGPDFAVETTPIENWLELEGGVSPTFSRRSTEWGTDLLFKKPFTLSKKAEFMFGVGPEWVHRRELGATSNSLAVEAALDFMFWPTAKHRFGWYFEPGYEYDFGRGHERSIAISGGLLIAIR